MESQNLLTIIRQCAFFKHVDEMSSLLLLHYGRIRLFQSGETIFKKGDFSRGTFGLIVSGQVGIISDTGQVIRGMSSGEILGELGVTSPQNKRTATVKAIKPTELFEWNADIMKAQLPEIIKRLKDLAWKNASNYYE